MKRDWSWIRSSRPSKAHLPMADPSWTMLTSVSAKRVVMRWNTVPTLVNRFLRPCGARRGKQAALLAANRNG